VDFLAAQDIKLTKRTSEKERYVCVRRKITRRAKRGRIEKRHNKEVGRDIMACYPQCHGFDEFFSTLENREIRTKTVWQTNGGASEGAG